MTAECVLNPDETVILIREKMGSLILRIACDGYHNVEKLSMTEYAWLKLW